MPPSASCFEVSVDRDFTKVFIKCLCRFGVVVSLGSTSVESDLTKLMKGFGLETEGDASTLDGEETSNGFCSVGGDAEEESRLL